MTASEKPTTVHLTYHLEDDSWWADSLQLPSLFAGGDSLDEAKELAKQAVRDELGLDVSIVDWMPSPAELEPVIASTGASGWGPVIASSIESDATPSVEWLYPSEPMAP